MTSPKRRIEMDVMKMLMSDYEVTLVNDNMQEFYVRFKGPTESMFISVIWPLTDILKHHSKAERGRFTSRSPISTHTSRHRSVSSIRFSTQTSMNCAFPSYTLLELKNGC
jgi:hypothetical protein